MRQKGLGGGRSDDERSKQGDGPLREITARLTVDVKKMVTICYIFAVLKAAKHVLIFSCYLYPARISILSA